MTAPHDLTASAAATLIWAGQLTSEARVRSCLHHIAAREADVRAWLALGSERALAEARAADRSPSPYRKPYLAGI
jgi:Asp-tRNA(Asn)/Glu-tRNA(Gln) amidotransferase A subunit family amidase